MLNSIKSFWRSLLLKLDNKINQWLNSEAPGDKELGADDFTVINFFLMILKKVLNRVFIQCEFEVVSDSALCDSLKELCGDLKKNCYKIGAYMLGGSDTEQKISECWVVPYFTLSGGEKKLFHSYVDGSRIKITETNGNRISDCYIILDAVRKKNKAYFLCRRHTLDNSGTLTISYFIADENANECNPGIGDWDSITQTETVFEGANHIGFGRYKSPVLAFGNTTYGKPLNNGCSVVEREIEECLNQIRAEFKFSGKRLFADASIVKTDKNGKKYINKIDEFIFPIQMKAGASGNMIEEFNPEIRESPFYMRLTKLLEKYQSLMGVNELITHEKSGNSATATEIKFLNLDNIALEDSIRQAIRAGNIDTLKADGMYLGIREDLWTYDETWTDIYEDEQQRTDNLLKFYNAGAAEQEDLIEYYFPTLSDDEVKAKTERINAAKAADINGSIENMLNL